MDYRYKLLTLVVISILLTAVLPFYIDLSWYPLVILPLLCYLTKGIGSEVGAHRLWSHRSFNTSLLRKKILVVLQTLAGEGSIIGFVIVHRLHHKYSDTNLDPHNPKLGVVKATFYQHNAQEFHFRLIKDLFNEPWLSQQHKYYFHIQLAIFAFLLLISPVLVWYYSANIISTLWINFLVNVVCHCYGSNDNNLTDNSKNNGWTDVFLIGVGQHNNHHASPGSTSNCWYDIWGQIIKIIKTS